MPNLKFKTCIVDGMEQYSFIGTEQDDQTEEIKTKRFPESLLSFADISMDTISPLFLEIDTIFKLLANKHDNRTADDILRILDDLAGRHVYFEFFRLEWAERVKQAQSIGPLRKLWQQRASHMPEQLAVVQRQLKELFASVLDIDGERKPVSEKMATYAMAGFAFQFRAQTMYFESWNGTIFTEVLYPESVYDIISYHFQECVRRELRFRVCKNCGRYFCITRRNTATYCHRPYGNKGGICSGIGPGIAWTQKRHMDEAFLNYRKEYKKRFARIKAGKLTQDDFYAWSKQAREKKSEYDTGKISYEVFSDWLRTS